MEKIKKVLISQTIYAKQYPERFWMYAGYRALADLSAKPLKQSMPMAVIRTQI